MNRDVHLFVQDVSPQLHDVCDPIVRVQMKASRSSITTDPLPLMMNVPSFNVNDLTFFLAFNQSLFREQTRECRIITWKETVRNTNSFLRWSRGVMCTVNSRAHYVFRGGLHLDNPTLQKGQCSVQTTSFPQNDVVCTQGVVCIYISQTCF